ncbi:hypothetical protein J1N35_031478 [Gossypium stocksii]|uniref:Uncharacterized protein n=1 Tax=Gossypium stocksii TaxID=47602 RepID=A0A9D3V1Y6_9ROSI|nr:hypothetical protein J1N35_031478 [Gossypium stocksii]
MLTCKTSRVQLMQLKMVLMSQGTSLFKWKPILKLRVETPKKKVKKTNVPVAELVYGSMLPTGNRCSKSSRGVKFCKPMMTNPKSTKPAMTETPPTPPPQGSEAQPQGADGSDVNPNVNTTPNHSATPSKSVPAGEGENNFQF